MRIDNTFFQQEAAIVAKELLGKTLVRQLDDGTIKRYSITATEAYCGVADKACHASKGRTKRTEVLYGEGGKIYVYLIYGMYWLLNFVTAEKENPHAVLICGINNIIGSGRVGRELQLDKSFYGEDLYSSERLWVEDGEAAAHYLSKPRVGVDYAGEWKDKLLRFEINL